MKRRDFLRTSSLVSAACLVPGFLRDVSVQLSRQAEQTRSLVVIQLAGGNDGLNTVVPFRDDRYYRLRPTLGLSPFDVLRIEDDAGLHPAMSSLRALYDEGVISIVQGVGYPQPNRSHKRATQIWLSGTSGEEYSQAGWLGRYMETHEAAGLRQGWADSAHSALAFKGSLAGSVDWRSSGVGLVSSVENEAGMRRNTADLYPQTHVGQRFMQVADHIVNRSGPHVFTLSINGFDTHVNQCSVHGRLLGEYSDALKAFLTDLKRSNRLDETLVLTFSEFGRSVRQNAYDGTDHGTANAVLLAGGKLARPGIIGEAPDLHNLDHGGLAARLDYRSIYSNILQDWLGVDSAGIVSASAGVLKVVS